MPKSRTHYYLVLPSAKGLGVTMYLWDTFTVSRGAGADGAGENHPGSFGLRNILEPVTETQVLSWSLLSTFGNVI